MDTRSFGVQMGALSLILLKDLYVAGDVKVVPS